MAGFVDITIELSRPLCKMPFELLENDDNEKNDNKFKLNANLNMLFHKKSFLFFAFLRIRSC